MHHAALIQEVLADVFVADLVTVERNPLQVHASYAAQSLPLQFYHLRIHRKFMLLPLRVPACVESEFFTFLKLKIVFDCFIDVDPGGVVVEVLLTLSRTFAQTLSLVDSIDVVLYIVIVFVHVESFFCVEALTFIIGAHQQELTAYSTRTLDEALTLAMRVFFSGIYMD